jgi:hypothetical protein
VGSSRAFFIELTPDAKIPGFKARKKAKEGRSAPQSAALTVILDEPPAFVFHDIDLFISGLM